MQKNKIINRAKENKLAIIFAVSTKKEQWRKLLQWLDERFAKEMLQR
jgi:hypothetical protein